MQCSNLNTHSSKCMILLECLPDQLRSRVLTDSLTLAYALYENYCFISEQPSDVYISIGPLRRLIYINCLWTTLRIIYINWAVPTVDILFSLDYPPIIYILDYPPSHFSLDSSHALTPIILGCSSAYGMHVCQFQFSLITCKYINMNILT